jgi:hypothetical protein
VVALRERGGRILTMAFKTEAASIDFIRSRVDRTTTVHADEAADWNGLHGRFHTRRIGHRVVECRHTPRHLRVGHEVGGVCIEVGGEGGMELALSRKR